MFSFKHAAVALGVVSSFGIGLANAAIVQFDLRGKAGAGMLTGNENPVVAATSSGGEVGAGITYDDVLNLLIINVGWGSGNGFSNLTGIVTAGHIHASASALFTTNGPVIIGLDGATLGFNSSPTNGGWTNVKATLTDAQEMQLFAGQLYLNVHTAANPGGEIRGNLLLVPEPASYGLALLALGGLAASRRRAK